MPLLSVTTNQFVEDEARPALLKALSETVAGALGKPERYVMVQYHHNPDMLFGGDNKPLAYVALKSIGLPDNRTNELSAALSQALQTQLGIDTDRIYIEFANAERHLWGWNGATFARD